MPCMRSIGIPIGRFFLFGWSMLAGFKICIMKTKQELESLHQLFLSANPNDWALAAAMGSKSDLERIMRLEAKRLRELSLIHGKEYLSLLGWDFLWYRSQAYWEGHGDGYTSPTFPGNLHRVKASWRKHFKQLKDNYEQD